MYKGNFFFAEMENYILKFTWTLKESQIAKTILGHLKDKDGNFTLPDFKSNSKCRKKTT
jgi:hypothetical protein